MISISTLREHYAGQPTGNAQKTIMNSTEYDEILITIINSTEYDEYDEYEGLSGFFVPDLFPTHHPDHKYGVNVFVNQFSLNRENWIKTKIAVHLRICLPPYFAFLAPPTQLCNLVSNLL